MRQKFILQSDSLKNELCIKEYANLEREQKNNSLETKNEPFTLLYIEKYNKDLIFSAIGKGKKYLIAAIRTANMYPNIICAEKIADLIVELYHSEGNLSVEVLFDEKELLNSEIISDTKL